MVKTPSSCFGMNNYCFFSIRSDLFTGERDARVFRDGNDFPCQGLIS